MSTETVITDPATAPRAALAATAAETECILHALADILDGITDEQANAPTPCTQYAVADLRAHVVGWAVAFGAGLQAADGRAADPITVPIMGSGSAQVRGAGAAIVAGIASGGGDRDLILADGAGMPGAMALAMILWEYQVHGWDLAVATAQPWSPGAEALSDSIAFAEQMLTPDFQGVGKAFGPRVAVPTDAPALDRLLALSGRDPRGAAPLP